MMWNWENARKLRVCFTKLQAAIFVDILLMEEILWLGLWPWKFPDFLETGEHLSHWFQSERPCSQSRFWKPQCSTGLFELNNPLWCVVSVYVLSFNPALFFATYHEGGSMGCPSCPPLAWIASGGWTQTISQNDTGKWRKKIISI